MSVNHAGGSKLKTYQELFLTFFKPFCRSVVLQDVLTDVLYFTLPRKYCAAGIRSLTITHKTVFLFLFVIVCWNHSISLKEESVNIVIVYIDEWSRRMTSLQLLMLHV